MKKLLIFVTLLAVLSAMGLYATVLIDPSGDGGFENGATLEANGWTVVNHTTNKWFVGAPGMNSGTNGAFISNDNGVTNAYTNTTSQTSHIYRDVTFPEGFGGLLAFNWKAGGESTWDRLLVYMAPQTVTPVAGTPASNSTTLTGATLVGTLNLQTTWQSAIIGLAAFSGAQRLIFTWQNDGSGGTQPPIAIDNISLETFIPTPLTGVKTIGLGGDYTTLTAAVNALHLNGIGAGGVTFNVAAGSIFEEDVPVITATGTDGNPIIFQKSGTGDNPLLKPLTTTAGIAILGGDYITFDGIDILRTGTSTTDYGYSIRGASGTNGAQYNTIKNSKIVLDRADTGTNAIYLYYGTSPSSADGACSYNKFQNLVIENSYYGIYAYGNSAYPMIGTEITGCTIGGETSGDISYAYGIYLYYLANTTISNNVIRNIGIAGTVYGIYTGTVYGNLTVSGNKIYGLVNSSTSSSSAVTGIYASLSTSTAYASPVANIFNNMIWGLSTNYTSTSTSYLVRGIYLGGATAAITYNVDYNSVRIEGPATANSAGVYFNANTAVNRLRNNVIVNNTPNQTGSFYHPCVYFSNATTIGATGSTSNNNVLYYANAGNGLAVRGSSTNYATIPAWNSASGFDADSRPTDPQFDPANPLNILTDTPTPVEGRAQVIEGISTDIFGNLRSASTPDIGAHEGAFEEERECTTPEAQPSNLVLVPYATAIGVSFDAADPAAEAYLVFGYQNPDYVFTPVDGTYYTPGQTIESSGTILSVGSATAVMASGLTADTMYYCKVFSYNTSGLNGPKYLAAAPPTASMQTLPAAPENPAALVATAASNTQINLTATANTGGNNILVAWNTTNTFGTPSSLGYNVSDPIVGGGTVLYYGPAAGLTNHTGLTGGTGYFYKAWSYVSVDRITYYSYSSGITASATTFGDQNYTQNFEGTFPPAGWTIWDGLLANPSSLTSTTGYWVQDDWVNVTTPVNKSARTNIYGSSWKYWLKSLPLVLPAGNYLMNLSLGLTDYNNAAAPDLNGTDDKFAILMGDNSSWSEANVVRKWDNQGSPFVYNDIPYTGASLSIPIYSDGSVQYIAFYGESTVSNADNDLFVDNLSFTTGTYTDLALSNLNVGPLYKYTDSPVTINLTAANLGHANSANVIIKANGTQIASLPTGTLGVGGSVLLSTEYTFTTPGTYTITAELPVDGNEANNLLTLPGVVIYVPGQLAEGFEIASWPPSRWQTWQGATENAWLQTTASNWDGASAAGVVLTTTNSSSYLATPKLTFTASDNTIQFYARATGTGQSIQCWYGESVDGTGYATVGDPIALTATYTQYTLAAPALAGGNRRIAFQAVAGTTAGTIYIDNVAGPMIYIPAEAPGAAALVSPVADAVNLMPQDIVLTWTEPISGGAATGYNIRVFQTYENYSLEDHEEATADGWWGQTDQLSYNLFSEGFTAEYGTDYWWQIVPFNDSDARVADCLPRKFTTRFAYQGDILVGEGQTYTSLTEDASTGLFKALNDGVITGNVNVLITSDLTETGAIALNQTEEGGTGGYTITIKPSAASMRTISGSLASNGLIRLNDADRVTIDGRFDGAGRYLTISNTSTSTPTAIQLARASDGAKNVEVHSSIISTASKTAGYGIWAEANSDYLAVTDNLIPMAGVGIYIVGTSSNVVNNLSITGNTVGNIADDLLTIGVGGMSLTYVSDYLIDDNRIENILRSSSPSPYGISLASNAINGVVSNNVVDKVVYTGTSGYGAFGIDIATGNATSNVIVANNMISRIFGDADYMDTDTWSYIPIGIRLTTTSGGFGLYHNSVMMSWMNKLTAYEVGSVSTALFVASVISNLDVRNNVFYNDMNYSGTTGPKAYAVVSKGTNAAFTNINNNLYYVGGPQGVFGYLGSELTSLQAWRTATGQDAASVFGNPQFSSNSELHINDTVASWVESRGQYLAAYPTDIDGEARNASTPDIGADEGEFIYVSPAVLPTAQPTALQLIPGSTTVNGSFAAAVPAAEAYLVVRHTADLSAQPVNETTYAVGGSLGGGTVVKVGASTDFATTGLTNSTAYRFTVYSYSSTGSGAPLYLTDAPLTGSVTTLGTPPANPTSVTPLASSDTQINITTVGNTADPVDNVLLAWSADGVFGTPLSNVNYVAGNSIPGGGIVLANGPAGISNHTSLNPFTTYYYKAWSVKQEGEYKLYSTGITANTYTHATVPYSQNFDASSSLPLGWVKLGSYGSFSVSTTYAYSPTRSVYVYGSSTSPGVMGALPAVSAVNTHAILKFWARGSSATTGILDVGYLTTPNDQNTFVSLQQVPIASTTFAQYSVPVGLIDGAKYLAIRSMTAVAMYMDDVSLEAQAATDLAATAINGPRYVVGNGQVTHAVSVTNNGTQAQTNYTVHLKRYGDDRYANTPGLPIQPGETIVHNITWDPSLVGFVPGTYSIVGEVELTGDLNASNDQTAQFSFGVFSEGTYIQDFESGAIPADWTILNADGGTYKWDIYNTGALSGTYCAAVRWESSSLVNNDWLITPALQLSADAGDQISFWLGKVGTTYPEDWQVLISTTDTNIASFTVLETGNLAVSGYTFKSYNLDAYGDAVVYVAIRYIGDNDLRFYADDFICPPLYKPAAPEVSIEQVPTGVKLTWQAVNHARSYQIYASDAPDGTYTLLTTVSGLEHTITAPLAKQFYKVVSSTLRDNPRGNMTISRSPEDQARFDYDEAVRNGKIME